MVRQLCSSASPHEQEAHVGGVAPSPQRTRQQPAFDAKMLHVSKRASRRHMPTTLARQWISRQSPPASHPRPLRNVCAHHRRRQRIVRRTAPVRAHAAQNMPGSHTAAMPSRTRLQAECTALFRAAAMKQCRADKRAQHDRCVPQRCSPAQRQAQPRAF